MLVFATQKKKEKKVQLEFIHIYEHVNICVHVYIFKLRYFTDYR